MNMYVLYIKHIEGPFKKKCFTAYNYSPFFEIGVIEVNIEFPIPQFDLNDRD
jgi:hypothetical protein